MTDRSGTISTNPRNPLPGLLDGRFRARRASSTAILRLPYSRDDSAWGSILTPITVARERRRPHRSAHRRQSWRRVRRADRALRPRPRTIDPPAITGRVDHRSGTQLPGLQGRHAHVADRQGQPQPLLPGRFLRQSDGQDRRLRHPKSPADGRHRSRLSTRAAKRSISCLSPPPTSSTTRPRRPHASPLSPPSGRPGRSRCWRSMRSACSTLQRKTMGKVFVTTELGGGGTATARTVEHRQSRGRQPPAPCWHPGG